MKYQYICLAISKRYTGHKRCCLVYANENKKGLIETPSLLTGIVEEDVIFNNGEFFNYGEFGRKYKNSSKYEAF